MRKLTIGQRQVLEYCKEHSNGNTCPAASEIIMGVQQSRTMVYERLKSLVKYGYLHKVGGVYFLNDKIVE